MNRMKESLYDGIIYILILSFLVFYIYSITISPYGVDDGYYIAVSRYIANGMIPWKDFSLLYTPVGLQVISLPFLYENSPIIVSKFIVLGFIYANTHLLASLLKIQNFHRRTIGVCVLLYLMMMYNSDGLAITLEPFTVFFCLLSLLLLFKEEKNYTYWLIGALTTLSFLSKQYGILTFPFVAIIILSRKGNITHFLGGCIGTILIWYIYYSIQSGNWYFIDELRGKNYCWRVAIFWKGYQNFLIRACLFIPMILFVWKQMTKEDKKMILLAGMGISLFSIPFIVRQYAHYGMLVYPFCILLFAYTWKYSCRWNKILLLSMFAINSVLCADDFKRMDNGHIKEKQESVINEIAQYFQHPTPTIVALDNDLYATQLFATTPNIIPVDYHHNKFGFEAREYPDKMIPLFKNSKALVIDESNLRMFHHLDSITFNHCLNRMTLVHQLENMQIYVEK